MTGVRQETLCGVGAGKRTFLRVTDDTAHVITSHSFLLVLLHCLGVELYIFCTEMVLKSVVE